MKIFLSAFFLVLLIPFCFCFSQQRENNLINRPDSIYRFHGIIPPIEFKYNLDDIFSKPVNTQIPEDVLFDANPSTIWLRTELSLSNNNFQFGSEAINTHFTSSLYKQYLKDSEFNMIRYVLGIAQTSAIAYMAYRHIKKYGFWK